MQPYRYCQDLYIDAGQYGAYLGVKLPAWGKDTDTLGGSESPAFAQAKKDAQDKADAWEKRVIEQLDKIHSTKTGAAVIARMAAGFKRTARELTVIPQGKGDTLVHHLRAWDLIRAETLRAVMQYEPEPAVEGSLRQSPDEVLMHELVHACRYANLSYTEEDLSWLRYKDIEEFLAILLTNVYSSEKYPFTKLRRFEYFETGVLEPELSTSEGFLGTLVSRNNQLQVDPSTVNGNTTLGTKRRAHVGLIGKLWRDERALFNVLQGVQAKFNPIQLYVAHQAQYDAIL